MGFGNPDLGPHTWVAGAQPAGVILPVFKVIFLNPLLNLSFENFLLK